MCNGIEISNQSVQIKIPHNKRLLFRKIKNDKKNKTNGTRSKSHETHIFGKKKQNS